MPKEGLPSVNGGAMICGQDLALNSTRATEQATSSWRPQRELRARGGGEEVVSPFWESEERGRGSIITFISEAGH